MARPAGYDRWSKKRRSKHWAGRRKARARADRRYDRDPLYNVQAPLTGAALKRAVDKIVDAELRPQLGALDRQARSATTQGGALAGRAGSYYQGLAQEAAGQEARSAALSRQLRERQQAITGQGQQAVNTAQAASQGLLDRDARERGSSQGGASEQIAAELAAARARNASNAQAAESTSENISGNYAGLIQALGQATASRGGEVQQQLANRLANELADVRGRRTDLEGSRGGLTSKMLTELRQQGFENLATAQTLGLKESELEAETEQAAADRALAERRIAETERTNRARERNQRSTERGRNRRFAAGQEDKDRKGRKEPESSRKARSTIEAIRQFYATQQSRNPGVSLRTIAQRARNQGASELHLAAAADLATKGYLPSYRIRQLKAAGISVPRRWRVRPRGQQPGSPQPQRNQRGPGARTR